MTEIRRPRAHITAPRNWMNDPNGLVFHDGRYHLFYQYNPEAPVWGAPWWGHVSSKDLAHWDDHPAALRPRPAGPDRDGCWSGCCRIVDGRPTIYYTAVVEKAGQRVESVCTASGTPDLLQWDPSPAPIIAGPPAEVERGYHRDPFVFGEPGAWRMLIGSGFLGPGHDAGAVLQYESPDLVEWSYAGVFFQPQRGSGPIDTGPLFECPQFFDLDGLGVLIFSVNAEDGGPDHLRYPVYCIGTLEDGRFNARTIERLDHGDVFYAPAVMRDATGRLLMWGWAQEKHGRVDVDHNGALTLPRVLRVEGGRLRTMPTPEVDVLRTRSVALGTLLPGKRVPVRADAFEVEGVVPAGARLELSLVPETGSAYRLEINRPTGRVSVMSGRCGPFGAVLPRHGGATRIRLFVDGSLAELFVDDEVAITTRYYEPPVAWLSIASEAGGRLEDATLHELGEAMPGRRDH